MVNILTCTTIFRILRRHQIQTQIQAQVQQDSEALNATRYRKSVFILVVLLILLILCYFPFICARVVVNSTGWGASRKRFVLRLTSSLVYLNSTLNLVVYCLRKREIRTAMIQF